MKGTALITGASSGLGRDFAHPFAADGHDVLLVARRLTLLDELAAELQGEHAITARTLACDLAEPGAATSRLNQS